MLDNVAYIFAMFIKPLFQTKTYEFDKKIKKTHR